jgi:cardiolipin synthase
MFAEHVTTIIGFIIVIVEILGIMAAIHAVMRARTSQAAIAWAIALVTFPFISLPLYFVFGPRKFHGYVYARRAGDREIAKVAINIKDRYPREILIPLEDEEIPFRTMQRLAKMPFTGYNDARLLVDGQETFDAIFSGISDSREYILVQFYIVRDDGLGRELKSRLIEKARQGVRVYFLYDAIGSYGLPDGYVDELCAAGIETKRFMSTKRFTNRLQINFRNHRKIVVVDGKMAFVGGHNVGDEYIGGYPELQPWRDTHVQIAGPSVLGVQLSFLEDWFWATQKVPELNWTPEHLPGRTKRILVLPSGPADMLDTCSLFFVHAINSARSRVWIVSPYFIPDEAVTSALQLAALRGVDVRIMVPEKADLKLVHLASFFYIDELGDAGVNLFRYQKGVLHQKVMVIDDDMASVGTANFDNRSFRLNFEITIFFADPGFATEVAEMLSRDFADCRKVESGELGKRSLPFQVAVQGARILSPLL